MKKLLLSIFAIGYLISAHAQTLLTENFTYGNIIDTITNPSIGGNLWKRHSGSSGPIVYLNTSLSFVGYGSSGIGGAVKMWNSTGSREDANIALNPITTGNVYVSFLININGSAGTTGDYFFHLNDSQGTAIGTNFRGKVWIKDGSVAGTFKIGLTKGASVASAVFGSDLNLNTTYLVVLKYSISPVTSTDDNVYAWVFSGSIPAIEPAAQLTATDVTQSDLTKVRSICLRQGTVGTDTIKLDGIRVASTWNDAALPIQYKSITVTRNTGNNIIKWATASESNNKGFEVQRSVNGGKYISVAFVAGAGNSNVAKNYAYSDIDNNTGNVCYRLKQMDMNGVSELSKVVCVNVEVPKTNNEMVTSPNPFNGSLFVKYHSINEGIITIQLIDMLGKTHQQVIETVSKGDNQVTLNTDALPVGIYFIRIVNGSNVTTQRIVKR